MEKLPDAANVAVGALFFGQFLGGQPFSLANAVLGISTWVVLTGVALFLARRDRS